MFQRNTILGVGILALFLVAFTSLASATEPLPDPGVPPGTPLYTSLDTMNGVTPATGSSISVPSYSSLPSAPYALYLNFGGINYPGSWDGRTPGNVPAYSIDSDTSTFSATELSNIQQIWARVSEAYSPFNVNITTVAPGSTPVGGQWSQIVIGAENASGSDWYGTAGGVAYINGFFFGGLESGTGWAFTNHLSKGNPVYTAVAAAHEAGHQFGLNHQRQYNSDGTLAAEYRPSTDGGYTSPIMGVGYYTPRALWSDGASDSATSHQYDLDILASNLGYRPDDGNNDIAHAKPLTVTGGANFSTSGVIKDMSENDLYSFTTGAGQVSINVAHNPNGGMLDSKLRLYAQDGTLLQTIDPDLTLTGPDFGLDAAFSGYLAAGLYYVDVTSHGDYGDVGTYSLTGSIAPLAPEPGSCVMLATGLACLLAYAWRRKRADG
jgi:hypothetical protein